jgi:C-terminal processing protease CtpA/Prc
MVRRVALASLVLGLLWVGVSSAQPAFTDKNARLIELAQVWAKVKVFHPYLGYKDLDWDAALVAAIPKVEAATTPAAYRAAVQDMLGKLGDPVTRMIDTPAPLTLPAAPALLTWLTPDIAQISLQAYFEQNGPLLHGNVKLIADTAKAKVIVFDLRNASWPEYVSGQFDDLWPAIREWPVQRVVEHEGFRDQEGSTSGDYFSTFVTIGSRPPTTGSKHPPTHVVFVTDETVGIPAVVVALQATGQATVVSATQLDEGAYVLTTNVELASGMTAQVRLGESLWAPPKADVVVAAKDLDARVLALAKQSLRAKASGHPPKPANLPPYRARDDLDYASYDIPPRELRMLAGIRLWATLEYFWPYRYLAGDWLAVLREMLPRLDAVTTPDAYRDTLSEMGARARDGHIGVWSMTARKAYYAPPFTTALVEGKLAVTAIIDPVEAKKAGIAVGDVIGSIGGVATHDAMVALEARISGSTDEVRDQNTATRAVSGTEPTVELGVRRTDGKLRMVTVTRTRGYLQGPAKPAKHYKVLANNIGYANLTTLQPIEVDAMFKELASTKALIFDMRGYPNGTAWQIAPRINTKHATIATQFDKPLVTRDNAAERESVHFYQPMPPLRPGASLYTGKIIVLIDYNAISQAEHTCMFFEAAAGATFIGSPTAGANGDITAMRLPGGLRMTFTGEEPRHADGRQLQRIGIEPTILVRPTLAGLRDGKDEILDRALAFVANGR